ncbi:uroporphyrinogen-III C-methyltransferase [Cephaloticoccus primus]|uniref:uroporphyrinogen-III C-methyltransferase n=1 Tax=Cephaloticoccus primus TaxID=1548207 RepID=UPI0008380645|nr:uroporphyrinogen-III C-methyltransferase [Cephaloticoccus primus]
MSKEQIFNADEGDIWQVPKGRVTLVGAGPGAPDLMTIRGERALAQADVVVYDDLANAALLEICRPEVRRIYVGKRAGQHSMAQAQISRILVEEAARGQQVVRLKGGDPLVFGRGGEEIAALAAAGIAHEIVPGVTAAVAAGASIGVPLTHRDHASAVVFATGHECCGKRPGQARVNWAALASSGATLCIYMGVRRLAEIVTALLDGGLAGSTPVAIVSNATLPSQEQHTTTLEQAPFFAATLKGKPSLIIVGEVAAWAAAQRQGEDAAVGAAEQVAAVVSMAGAEGAEAAAGTSFSSPELLSLAGRRASLLEAVAS